jgi:hypothetical protein
LETILDDEEFDNELAETSLSAALTMSAREGSETPSQELSKASSPTSSTVTSASMSVAPYHASDYSQSPVGRQDWSHLPLDFQKHLDWFVEHISYLHYCLPIETDEFLKTILPNMAAHYEPLLNAVVGFAAYHQTLRNPQGKLEDFLHYYNKSVTLLLGFLKRKEKYNVSTLLTILQLATIEVSSLSSIRRSIVADIKACVRNIWATGSISWAIRKRPSRSSPKLSTSKQ